MNDLSLIFLAGVLVGMFLAGAVDSPKGEIETKEPLKEEQYEHGLYTETYAE